MRRVARIFLLHFEHLFEHRLRSLVWFLIPFTNVFVLIIFWSGTRNNQTTIGGWSINFLTSYYLFLAAANAFTVSHIEEDISDFDIKQGDLVRYLLRPFPYFWIKMFEEVSYRFLQGFYGILIFFIVTYFFKNHFYLVRTPEPVYFILAVSSFILGYLVSFTYKMNLGLLSFWFKENRGLWQLLEIITVVFSGFIIPVDFLPSTLKQIALLLPFSYIVYFPTLALLGKMSLMGLLKLILSQTLWLLLFMFINRYEWRRGIKSFTAIGR